MWSEGIYEGPHSFPQSLFRWTLRGRGGLLGSRVNLRVQGLLSVDALFFCLFSDFLRVLVLCLYCFIWNKYDDCKLQVVIDRYDRWLWQSRYDRKMHAIDLSIYLPIYLYHIYVLYLCIISIYQTYLYQSYHIYQSYLCICHNYLPYLFIKFIYRIYLSYKFTQIIISYVTITSINVVIIYVAIWTCSHVWATWILDLSKILVR